MLITVVIPTYNEAENLPRIVGALFGLPLNLRVLVVDDNSPDGTGKIAERLKLKYGNRLDVLHRKSKGGLGPAYIAGFRRVLERPDTDAICQMDADFSHDPSVLPVMAVALEDGADLVVGSRYVPGGELDERWPLWRKGLSAFGNLYARSILRIPLRDVTGGYRLWRASALRALPLGQVRSSGYIFQVEMAYLAYRFGLKMVEIPIYFADRRFGKSKMSFPIQIEAALGVWRLKWRYRHFPPKDGRTHR